MEPSSHFRRVVFHLFLVVLLAAQYETANALKCYVCGTPATPEKTCAIIEQKTCKNAVDEANEKIKYLEDLLDKHVKGEFGQDPDMAQELSQLPNTIKDLKKDVQDNSEDLITVCTTVKSDGAVVSKDCTSMLKQEVNASAELSCSKDPSGPDPNMELCFCNEDLCNSSPGERSMELHNEYDHDYSNGKAPSFSVGIGFVAIMACALLLG